MHSTSATGIGTLDWLFECTWNDPRHGRQARCFYHSLPKSRHIRHVFSWCFSRLGILKLSLSVRQRKPRAYWIPMDKDRQCFCMSCYVLSGPVLADVTLRCLWWFKSSEHLNMHFNFTNTWDASAADPMNTYQSAVQWMWSALTCASPLASS